MSSKCAGYFLSGLVGALAVFGFHTAFAQSSDACKKLTPTQVGAALDTNIRSGEPIGATGCGWTSSSAPNMRATLMLMDASGWVTMKTPLPGITKTAATGIGDDAFYATVANLTTLSVKKAETVFVVRVYGIEGRPRQMAVEKTLAQEVLANP